jgi:hypothetical protein
MEFTQEQLARVLTEQKVAPNESKLAPDDWVRDAARHVAASLPEIARQHRVRRQNADEWSACGKDQIDRLRKVQTSIDSLLQAVDIWPGPRPPLPLHTLSEKLIEAMRLLRNEAEQTQGILKSSAPPFLKGKKQVLTKLYLDLFVLYFEITGKGDLGDKNGNGPFYRFAKECANLIDPELDFPEPGALRKLLRENKARKWARGPWLGTRIPLEAGCEPASGPQPGSVEHEAHRKKMM